LEKIAQVPKMKAIYIIVWNGSDIIDVNPLGGEI